MAITQTIDAVRDWCQTNVCNKILLKSPDDNAVDDAYPYKLIHPTAFSQFQPTGDKTTDGVPAIPSVVVRATNGTDRLITRQRETHMSVLLTVWNPGLHGADVISPNHDESNSYSLGSGSFLKNDEGWRDAFNFLDFFLRTLEDAEFLNGLRVKKENGITFNQPTLENSPKWMGYPYYFASLEFDIEEPIERKHDTYDDLL